MRWRRCDRGGDGAAVAGDARFGPEIMRYDTGILLGQGGMGEVYKAWDPALERHVALKFLRVYSPEAARRLLREARAQARLDHPAVCRVYEVGEDPLQPYIAMQLVDGAPLQLVAPRMSLEQRVRVLEQVADAVHEAHRIGLTHRDLKPANILVEDGLVGDSDGTERWRPFVVDFGLVHQADGTMLTADGAVLGTPPYMAPEQADGTSAEVDRRSDVYGLGATLYEVLTGRPVFEGTPAEMLLKTLQQEPVAPRRQLPHLPVELEVIVLKCLEKDPGRRYGSARALAEDLRRFLDGEPILARAPSLVFRWRRSVRKHRALAVVTAVALGISAIFGGVALEARWQAQRRAEIAQRFTGEVKDLEWLMRATRMSPLHDARPQEAEVRRRMARLEDQARDLGPRARSVADYAIGRGHLALRDTAAARRRLEAAWEAGYRPPEEAFALGLVYGELYQQGLVAAQGIADAPARQAAIDAARERWRAPALELLETSRGGAGVVPDYLEGLIAFYEEDYEASLEAGARALEQAPWLYEAQLLRGEALAFAGNGHRDAGRHDPAAETYARAEAALRQAVAMAPSDPETYRRLCALAAQRIELEVYGRGGDVESLLAPAVDSCHRGLVAAPDHAGLFLELAGLWAGVGAQRSKAGNDDPAPAWEEASTYARRAAELAPTDERVWHVQASVYADRARYSAERGDDPRQDFDRALDAARRGAELAPEPTRLLNLQGIVGIRRASYELTSGKDPSATLRAAARALEHAAELDPGYGYAFNNLGRVHGIEARYQARQGLDPRPALLRSAEALRQALALNPENAVAWNNLGVTLNDRGFETLERGEDPQEDLGQAVESFRRCQAVNPEYGPAFNNLALSAIHLARYRVYRGLDPTPVLEPAYPALEKTVRLVPRAYQPHMNLGRAEALRAEYRALAGHDPAPLLERSRDHYRRALELNPRQAGAHAELATVEIQAVRHLLETPPGSAALQPLERAQHHAEEALSLAPDQVPALTAHAEASLLRALLEPARARTLLAVAESDVERALAKRPVDAEGARVAADLALAQAGSHGPGAAGALRRGLERLAPALGLDPHHPRLLLARARLRLAVAGLDGVGDVTPACADVERALELNPLLGGDHGTDPRPPLWARPPLSLGAGLDRARCPGKPLAGAR